MKIINTGSTRIVILTKRFAIKIPKLGDFEYFVSGLLSNLRERRLSKLAPDYFCPVLFSIPGLIVVMPRVKTLERAPCMVHAFMFDLFNNCNNHNKQAQVARNYCEYAYVNYGMYRGRVVAIDYGTWVPFQQNWYDLKHYKHLLTQK
jgi:hypothetical protein